MIRLASSKYYEFERAFFAFTARFVPKRLLKGPSDARANFLMESLPDESKTEMAMTQ
jgi:hypothetical protein